MPWRLPVNLDWPTEPLDSDAIAAIHDGAMSILEEIGINFLNQEALRILKKRGPDAKLKTRMFELVVNLL